MGRCFHSGGKGDTRARLKVRAEILNCISRRLSEALTQFPLLSVSFVHCELGGERYQLQVYYY